MLNIKLTLTQSTQQYIFVLYGQLFQMAFTVSSTGQLYCSRVFCEPQPLDQSEAQICLL